MSKFESKKAELKAIENAFEGLTGRRYLGSAKRIAIAQAEARWDEGLTLSQREAGERSGISYEISRRAYETLTALDSFERVGGTGAYGFRL